jgi:hypothetical protein
MPVMSHHLPIPLQNQIFDVVADSGNIKLLENGSGQKK